MNKITDLRSLTKYFSHPGKVVSSKIVYLTGAFDVPHVAHTRYLKKAKELGTILVVGLRSDNWIREEKGDSRPVFSWEERVKHLSCYLIVDYIIHVDDPKDMHKIINKINPDFIVVSETNDDHSGKSPEWMKNIYGDDKVVVLPAQSEIHSTDLIRIMRKE